jgi:hypothetical protein
MKTKMKRVVLLILVLLLMADLAEDGYLGKPMFLPPHSSAKTSVTSSHHLDSNDIDFCLKIAAKDWPGTPRHGDDQPIILGATITLQIIHCCHISGSGGVPL